MHLDRTIASLSERSDAELERMSINCAQALWKQRNNPDARKLCVAVDAIYVSRSGVTNGWTTGRQGEPRLFLANSNVLGAVRRVETHTSRRKDVYLVEVDKEVVDQRFTNVDEARSEVEKLLGSGGPC